MAQSNKQVYKKAVRTIPECDDEEVAAFDFLEAIFTASYHIHATNVDFKDGETTFNAMFVFPFLDALATFLAETKQWCKAGFRHGEAPLKAMATQLKTLEFVNEDIHSYLADGILKLYGLKGLEVMLVETSGCFGSTDRPKHSFDHHKGVFGSLSMLKSIAGQFFHATIDTFCKMKVFFVHAAGEKLYLWSLRYEHKGPIFDLWLETILLIKPEIDDNLEFLPNLLNFFWVMKCLLTENLETIECLKQEHNTFLSNNLMKYTR